jgi:hypothetical protein
MITIHTVLKFISNPKNFTTILITLVLVLIFFLLQQCNSNANSKAEIQRHKNNQIALQDTVRNYKDKYGNSVGEIRALSLTIGELNDSIKFHKNKPPVTLIKKEVIIKEKIVNIPVYITSDSISDWITFEDSTFWKSSYRAVKGKIPFQILNDSLIVGKANIDLTQKLDFSTTVYQDKKTKEYFVEIKTDHPDATFQSIQAINVHYGKDMKQRKQFGVSVVAGYGYNFTTNQPGPIIGAGVSWTPKFLQW